MSGRFSHPPSRRLRKRTDFDLVFKQGQKQAGRHFVCYAARIDESGNRLGLVVSRKVGKAVVRNRVKRYIREYFRTHQEQFEGPVALVVVARPEAATLDGTACAESLRLLLERRGVLRG